VAREEHHGTYNTANKVTKQTGDQRKTHKYNSASTKLILTSGYNPKPRYINSNLSKPVPNNYEYLEPYFVTTCSDRACLIYRYHTLNNDQVNVCVYIASDERVTK
jgi:hypothetical protein